MTGLPETFPGSSQMGISIFIDLEILRVILLSKNERNVSAK